MKKIIISILCLLPVMAYGVDVCVKNNTYISILKNNVDGTPTADDNNKVWRVVFDYKTITGDAACNDISGTVKSPITNLYTDAEDSGPNCWCRMWPITSYGYETGPSSYWILLQTYTGASAETDCENGCTTACANAVATNTNPSGFRDAVFESMW